MVTTKKRHLIRLFTFTFLSALLMGCAQYGVISENDVYMQQPTALGVGEDESDITSYNAYKARQRGAYQDEYLIDQMYSRQMIGNALYGVRPMFGMPLRPGGFISWGYRSPILAYQNSFYYPGNNHWYNPYGYNYGYGYGYGYNPCATGFYNYGYNPFNNCGYGHNYGMNTPLGGPFIAGNGSNSSNNVFTGRPRISLSSNSSRSSTYPNTLKSSQLQSHNNSISKDHARRSIQKKQVRGNTHMPFRDEANLNSSTNNRINNSTSRYSESRNNVSSRTRNVSTSYKPSSSARRSGVVRSPRSTTNTSSRSGYYPTQNRRGSYNGTNSYRGSSSRSTPSRSSASGSSRSSSSSSSRRGSSSGSSSSSSSGRR